MSDTLRVLLVTVGLRYGGVERMLATLAPELAAAGARVAVLALRRGGPLVGPLRAAGVPVLFPGPGGFDVAAATRVLGGRPDVLHSHLPKADLVAGLVAPTLGIASVTTLHSLWAGLGLSPMRAVLMRRIYRRFDAIVSISAAVTASFVAEAPASPPTDLIKNPIEPLTPAEEQEALALRASRRDRRHVVGVGRLVPEKGFATLVALAQQLPPDVDVTVFGDGPLRADLQAQAQGRVRFAGVTSRARVEIAAADVVVMPSRVEGDPLVALEALVAGTPLVATNAGGLQELLATSPLPPVAVGDSDGLARSLARALREPGLRAAFAAWSMTPLRERGPQAAAARTLDVYQRIRRPR